MLQALRARSPAGITEFPQVPRSTVYCASKCVREEQGVDEREDQEEITTERKKKSGPEKMRTSAFLHQVQELIQEDPRKSLRQLVRELDVSPCLIRQAVMRMLMRMRPCSKDHAGVVPAAHALDVDQGVLTAILLKPQLPRLLCLGRS